ncbi:MAG: excinuclease ABC subunit UvrC, partial [Acidobacteria bacterium]|nr:excinuclease ABC subunit UvrC [Acidobacteriota bacterium]
GKAKSLRKRVPSYLSRDLEPRLRAMVDEARELEYVATASEQEALLLENNFIKSRKPRYNVLLRDDKTYPYLKLTREPWPRLVFTRRIRDDGAQYFGPYLPGGLARRAIKLAQKLFGIRVCRIEIDGGLPRPCLYWDMKRCLGPCVEGLTTSEEYADAVESARLFLAGKIEPLARRLRADMRAASEALEFERAARLRDLLAEVERQGERASLASVEEEDADLFGVAVHGRQAAVSILVMRGGQVLDRRELFWEGDQGAAAESVLGELLPQIYDRTTFLPKEIHLPAAVEGDEALAAWLSSKKGERVYLRYPVRGVKAERLRVAGRDAEFAFRRRFRVRDAEDGATSALRHHLDLADAPRWIEGFDVSHTQGVETVASLVVWRDGKLRKSDYRSFNIKGLPGPDDFRAVEQAVERRYRRLVEETGAVPDLVLIDGGRGQLNAALAALARLGLEEMPVAALAKREEEVYRPGLPEPLRLPREDPGLQLLQRIRDETHRFALARHRARRGKRSLRSRLDDVPGIGPRRKRLLLERFGTVDRIL